MAIILGLFLVPFLVLAMSFIRALLLFWPIMILFGAVHSHIPWVPNLSWQATFLVVALVGLLIPTGASANSNKN